MNIKISKKGVILFAIFFILGVYLISAAWTDIFKFKFGKKGGEGELAESNPAHATIVLANEPPIIIKVFPPENPNLAEDTTAVISFKFVVYDPNGVNDIDNPTASGKYLNSDNTPNHYNSERTGSCSFSRDFVADEQTYPGYGGKTVREFICNINMYYYDEPDLNSWTIRASIKDKSNNEDIDEDTKFAPNVLEAFKLRVGNEEANPELTWTGISSSSQNVYSQNPLKIVNTGNVIFDGTVRKFEFRGRHLYGETDNTKYIPANKFQISTQNNNPCTVNTQKIDLEDNNYKAANFINLKFGDNTQAGHADVNTYVCLYDINVPGGLPAQGYSTKNPAPGQPGGDPWIIRNA